MEYFIKLKTNEKIYCTKEELEWYLHRTKGDFISIKTPKGWVHVFRENILLGGSFE